MSWANKVKPKQATYKQLKLDAINSSAGYPTDT